MARTFRFPALFCLVLTLVLSGLALSQEKEKPRPKHFVVLYAPGEAWVKEKKIFEQPGIQEHAAYHRKLCAEGKVLLGGPYMDARSGGQAILQVTSVEEAKQLVADDPILKSKVMKAELRPWLIAIRPAPKKLPAAKKE